VSDPASALFEAYRATRDRMTTLAESLSPTDLRRTVPACPSWTVFDLMAHVVSMPAAIGRGERPPGTVTEWLQSLVEARQDQDIDELTREWCTLDGAIASILNGPGAVLFGDLAVHEHDLRGAVDVADHTALEVDVMLPRTLAAFAAPLRAAGLGAIEVRHEGRTWCSHDSDAGWTLAVSPWEAVRAVNSRRTADELRGLPHHGDVEPYLAILHAHLPLPTRSLHEP
jgi:Mycothiol maleylpyruvate isomerase N-terminal domain